MKSRQRRGRGEGVCCFSMTLVSPRESVVSPPQKNHAHTLHAPIHARSWVTPFRAVWSPAGDAVLCGNMSRAVDVFSAATGALVGASRCIIECCCCCGCSAAGWQEKDGWW